MEHVFNIFEMHSLISARKRKKMEIFDRPQIRQLIQHKNFTQEMTPVKTDAWLSFESVTKNFLGNTKVGNYVHLINDMLAKLKKLTVQMSIRTTSCFSIWIDFFHLDIYFLNFHCLSQVTPRDEEFLNVYFID